MENKNIKKFYQQAPKPFNYVPSDLVSGGPVLPPTMSGLMRIDPDSGDIWVSAGNTLVSDWKLITGGGGGGGGSSDQGIYNNAGTFELGAPTFAGAPAIAFQTDRYIDLSTRSLNLYSSSTFALMNFNGAGSPYTMTISSPAGGIQTTAGFGYGIDATGLWGGNFSGDVYGINSSSANIGVSGTGTNTGVLGVSVTGIPFVSNSINPDASATPTTVLLSRNCNPTVPVNGIGQAIEFQTSVTTPGGTGVDTSNKLVSKFSNITNTTRTSQFEIQGINSGGPVEAQVTVKGTGLVQYNKYGSATFNGTVRYLLAVDTSGNIQEVTTAGLTNAINDAAAQAAGVPVNGIYRNGSALQIRVV
jgi:hypothetical protein